MEISVTSLEHSVSDARGARQFVWVQFFDLMFKFLRCEWGHEQWVCSGCGSRSLFFHSRKEFGHVLCTFLIVG